jgi:hypothetical protein
MHRGKEVLSCGERCVKDLCELRVKNYYVLRVKQTLVTMDNSKIENRIAIAILDQAFKIQTER